MRLHFNRGGYKPSLEEDLLAPFFRDPSQQMVAFELYRNHCNSIFVMKIHALLKLARKFRGADLKLEQFRTHMVKILPMDPHTELWVSDSRSFSTRRNRGGREVRMEVFDLSARASALDRGTDRSGRDDTAMHRRALSASGCLHDPLFGRWSRYHCSSYGENPTPRI